MESFFFCVDEFSGKLRRTGSLRPPRGDHHFAVLADRLLILVLFETALDLLGRPVLDLVVLDGTCRLKIRTM